jgi:hypothetical protein
VYITKEVGEEYCIEVPHLFYLAYDTKKPQSTFWTLKSNILKLNDIENKEQLPPLIDHKKNYTTLQNKNMITLLGPWHDKTKSITHSAGTRFIIDEKKSTKTAYAAYVLDRTTKACTLKQIPKSIALSYHNWSPAEQQKQFVMLLKKWAHMGKGSIAYVWGGCSFTTPYQPTEYIKVHKELPNKTLNYFERPWHTPNPKAGLECAGLIMRAAQAVGLPYFYKNTTTLAECMKEVKPGEPIMAGDLIWISGHVMAISDVENNLLIEARTYAHGYGIVHEAPLNQIFKGINTYAELQDAQRKKLPLQRLKKDGSNADTFKEYKILKMSSIWDHSPNVQ